LGGVKVDTVDKVLQVFKQAGGPMRPGEVAEKAGIERKEVDKAIKQLKKEEKIHSPKRCFYSISE
jgi:biotin operon repressor